jgi:hypothetical protein
MSRLPVPGEDDGTWGEILNDYLSQTLSVDGQLKAGAVGSTQIQAGAVTAAKLSQAVVTALTQATTAVQTVNSQTPDSSGNITIPVGPQGEQGIQGEPGTNGTDGLNGTNGIDGADGASITVTLISAADWPPPSDPDPLHWYIKVP